VQIWDKIMTSTEPAPVTITAPTSTGSKVPTNYQKLELNKTEWLIPLRYSGATPVGSGAYGQVWLVNSVIACRIKYFYVFWGNNLNFIYVFFVQLLSGQ